MKREFIRIDFIISLMLMCVLGTLIVVLILK